MSTSRPYGPGYLTREQRRSLWLHRAVAGKLAIDPEPVLAFGRRNLEHLRDVHPEGPVRGDFDKWEALLNGPLEDLFHALASESEEATDLRQNTPFAGTLAEWERLKVLQAFRDSWRAA